MLTLTVLEVVLGIDNLVFLAITSSRLPVEQQKFARQLGLLLQLQPAGLFGLRPDIDARLYEAAGQLGLTKSDYVDRALRMAFEHDETAPSAALL